MRTFFVALVLSLAGLAHAEQPAPLPLDACKVQAPYGFPTTKKQSVTPICRNGYFTIHDNKAKIPALTAYVLKPAHAVGCGVRDSTFEVDRSLPPSNRSGNKDYAKSGYDIGHMANAEDLKYDPLVQSEAALLSNAVPQLPEFNRGVWKKLEDTTRGWVLSRQHDILIYIAPITSKTSKTIGKGFVTVPDGFVKILVDTRNDEVQVFMFKHEGSKAPLSAFITSLADAQKQTGVQFPMPTKPKFGSWQVQMKSNQQVKGMTCALK